MADLPRSPSSTQPGWTFTCPEFPRSSPSEESSLAAVSVAIADGDVEMEEPPRDTGTDKENVDQNKLQDAASGRPKIRKRHGFVPVKKPAIVYEDDEPYLKPNQRSKYVQTDDWLVKDHSVKRCNYEGVGTIVPPPKRKTRKI